MQTAKLTCAHLAETAHLHHAWETYNRYGRSPAALKRAAIGTGTFRRRLFSRVPPYDLALAKSFSLPTRLYSDPIVHICFSALDRYSTRSQLMCSAM